MKEHKSRKSEYGKSFFISYFAVLSTLTVVLPASVALIPTVKLDDSAGET